MEMTSGVPMLLTRNGPYFSKEFMERLYFT